MRHVFLIIMLLLLFFLAGAVAAQLSSDALSVSLVADPPSPSPGKTFMVVAATPTFDSNTAFFNWSLDGKTRTDLSGQGKNIITLRAGPLGSSVRINVTVSGPGANGSGALTIRISDLALAWFAETYVPKWYKGKALPVPNSVVDVIALPNIAVGGERIRPEELIYHWSLGDEENVRSGVGEQVFRVKLPDVPQGSQHIRVMVEDTEKRIRKEGELFVIPTKPRAIIYPATPLGGVEARSIFAFLGAAGRALRDFQVEPFFFPVGSRRDLSYRWRVADEEVVGNPENPFLLTVDTTGQPTGEVSISANVDDQDPLIPSASHSLTLPLP